MRRRFAIAAIVALAVACGSSERPKAAGDGTNGLEDGGSFGFGAGDAGDAGADGADGGGTSACTNGLDDDGDGKIDSADPECTGPLDDDEATFGDGLPGDNKDPCRQDCMFDGNSGSGDDGCDYDLACDPLKPAGAACEGDGGVDASAPACTASQSDLCHSSCLPRTPNGCDCFGCCQFAFAGGTIAVRLTESCTSDRLADTTACLRCTPVADCFNSCETCEVCTSRALPKECTEPSCPSGGIPCTDAKPCPSGDYCLTGCCVEVVR